MIAAEFNTLASGFIESAISIFAIVNPIGNIPVFMGLTEDYSPPERRRILCTAGITALVLILIMGLLGRFVLQYVFHIGMDEFMFGGGVLLIVVGVSNILKGVTESKTCMNNTDRLSKSIQLAISPIGCPLLVGPGSIVTTMLIIQKQGLFFGILATLAAFLFVLLIIMHADRIGRLIGRIGMLAIGRIMQIFIIAIGTGFIFRSLKHYFSI